MGATFPNGIASFKQHVDLIDDVTAPDINKIQDEVVALQELVGEMATEFQVVEKEITNIDREVDNLEADNLLDTQRDTSLLVKYNTLKDMIQALWDGKNIYAAEASLSNKKLRVVESKRPYPPDLVTLNKPSSSADPMAMWNGTGFTLKKSGFWNIQGEIHVNLASIPARDRRNYGLYEASLTLNGTDWTRSLDRQYPITDDRWWHDVVLRPSLMGWLAAGTRVQLRAAQSSELTQNMASARLSLHRVRG
jgi:hypothetical protein